MKYSEFINLHLKEDTELVCDKRFDNSVEKLSRYVNYLKLLQKKEVYRIFQELNNNVPIWNGCLRGEFKKETIRYFIDLLLAEGLIKTLSQLDNIHPDISASLGEKTILRTRFYILTQRGRDLIKTNGVKSYLRGNK